jgi:hypothetical protein
MNRIELIRALRQEAGYSGTGPVSSAGAAGQTKELVDRVDQAWLDIQTMSMWDWMWEQATITVPAGQSVSAATGIPHNRYVIDSLRSPYGRMGYLTWRDFSETFEPQFSEGLPSIWTVRPDTAIAVNAVAPPGDIVLTVERYRNPIPFAADTDVPALPVQYHMLIVWLAMMRVAAFDESGSRYLTAKREYDQMFNRLQSETVVQMQLGAPLA